MLVNFQVQKSELTFKLGEYHFDETLKFPRYSLPSLACNKAPRSLVFSIQYSDSIQSFLLKESVNIFKFSHRRHIWKPVFVSYSGGRQDVVVKDLVPVSGGVDYQGQLSE